MCNKDYMKVFCLFLDKYHMIVATINEKCQWFLSQNEKNECIPSWQICLFGAKMSLVGSLIME